ncbi:dTDP-4-dehydrorhamnose reductase [soil metagenome]
MRVLVTGADGQVGRELVAVLDAAGHEIVATDQHSLDVSDRDQVLQAVATIRPATIVHTAAWTAVDACESDPDQAFRVNALAVRHVAEAARRFEAHVCHLSTDYVFDGTKPEPYLEWDQPNPQSVYGRSKLGGEWELDSSSTLVRTAWVCGQHGSNMVKTILRLASEREQLSFVDDQHGSPTFAADLAAKIVELVVGRRPGTFHVTNQGATTWYGLARAVMASAGLDPDRVRPIATAELDPPRPAPRPANSVLDNTALRLGGLSLLPPWQESADRLVRELRG